MLPNEIDIALNNSGEIYLAPDGDLATVSGRDLVRQRLVSALRLFLGEWYLNEDDGVPYYQQIFVNAPRSNILEAILRRQIMASSDVLSIDSFSMTIDRRLRAVHVDFTVQSTVGPVQVAEEF
jgi:hypothetical protein